MSETRRAGRLRRAPKNVIGDDSSELIADLHKIQRVRNSISPASARTRPYRRKRPVRREQLLMRSHSPGRRRPEVRDLRPFYLPGLGWSREAEGSRSALTLLSFHSIGQPCSSLHASTLDEISLCKKRRVVARSKSVLVLLGGEMQGPIESAS